MSATKIIRLSDAREAARADLEHRFAEIMGAVLPAMKRKDYRRAKLLLARGHEINQQLIKRGL
jgi:hypothetical protein